MDLDLLRKITQNKIIKSISCETNNSNNKNNNTDNRTEQGIEQI